MIGLQLTRNQIDLQAGQVALELAKVMRQVAELHHFFLITPDSVLVSLGYSSAEVATVKSAFGDGDLLRQVYEGSASLPAAQDFRVNLSQLAGTLVT
jgi:hypothetical protein